LSSPFLFFICFFNIIFSLTFLFIFSIFVAFLWWKSKIYSSK
jgi:hypothetical protein